MLAYNPDWETYLQRHYAAHMPETVFKYRSDEIEYIEQWRAQNAIQYPAEVEIGSNRGRFILGLCRARKDYNFVGIELKSSLVRLANNKLKRESLDNGKVINADARLAIPILFEPQSLSAIYVLFPDPWWKKKHAKRKLLDHAFFSLIHHFLKPGGVFVLKTDVLDYFNDVQTLLSGLQEYKPITQDQIPHQELWEQTTRERHCIADATPYYCLGAVRL